MTVQILDDEEVVVRSPEELKRMPRAYQRALISQITINTEGELTGGDDYTMMFLPMAPNAEERQVCAERAAEEYDHYKIGKRVLAEIGIDTSHMEQQTIADRRLFSDQRLHQCTTWAERGIYSYIGEESALLMIKEFAQGSYKPWADAVRTIILDEKIHIAHGARVCRNLATTEEGREQLQAGLNRLWPVFKDLFGTPESLRSQRAVRFGLRKTTNAQALQEWENTVRPRIHALGLVVPE
jgi:ring-1,2-phenylacetyl-CoA epoxidase subunit PaaA